MEQKIGAHLRSHAILYSFSLCLCPVKDVFIMCYKQGHCLNEYAVLEYASV